MGTHGGVLSEARLLAWATRWRWPLLLVSALVVAWFTSGQEFPPDAVPFARYGRELLTGHFGAVYADPYDQAGPLQLIQSYLCMPWAATHLHVLVLHVVGDVTLVALALLVTRRIRSATGLRPSPGMELAVGAVLVAWVLPGNLWNAHFAEVAIPGLWCAAAFAAQRGRPWLAGALLAAATGFEPWGVLAAPVVLIDPRPTRVARATTAFVVLAAAAYAPFALTGHFALFAHRWPIGAHTLVHAMFPHAQGFTWPMRLLQACVAMGGCAGAALYLRGRSVNVVWLAPLVAVLARLLLDPTQFDYYWLSAVLLSLVAVALLDRPWLSVETALSAGLVYLPFLRYGDAVVAVVVVNLALALVAVVWHGRPSTQPAPEASVRSQSPALAAAG